MKKYVFCQEKNLLLFETKNSFTQNLSKKYECLESDKSKS